MLRIRTRIKSDLYIIRSPGSGSVSYIRIRIQQHKNLKNYLKEEKKFHKKNLDPDAELAPDPDPLLQKGLDPDPYLYNKYTDPQHCLKYK